MNTVILIEENKVTVVKPDGSLIIIDINNFEFEPKKGDNVNIVQLEETIVVKKSNKIIIVPKTVNKKIYLLLTVFLGNLGAHKFYAGNIKSGLLHFFFAFTFIPYIFAIFDFFRTLKKQADEFGNILV